jgi:hypothetical protein
VGELVRGGTPRIELRIAGTPPPGWPAAFADHVRLAASGGDSVLTLHDPARLQPLLAWLVERRAEVRSVTPMRTSLEELFMAAAEDAAMHASEQRRSA